MRIVIHLKSDAKAPNSFVMRDYSACTFSTLQPLVDGNEKLQSLFTNLEPEIIAEKLLTGMKEVTDVAISKRRIQKRERGVPFWNANLEEERKSKILK